MYDCVSTLLTDQEGAVAVQEFRDRLGQYNMSGTGCLKLN